LKAQGPAVKGGAKSYLNDGHLTGGIALIAFPAQYKVSGVMSFLINQNGVVYQKDLGEKTADIARAVTEYKSRQNLEARHRLTQPRHQENGRDTFGCPALRL
jgi:hypothetical protein